jgi:TRAP transporter TAXI family solute receptor
VLKRAGALALMAATGAAAQNFETNIVAGPAGGTDARMARDIVDLAAGCGFEVAAPETAGDIENLLAVRDRRVTQFGFVQDDVLEYFRTFQTDDPEIGRALQGIRIAIPLHLAEVHVLARNDMESLADLDGARVAVGAVDDGTAVTASLVLDLAGVTPAERLELAPDAALEALDAGRADAVFLVEGAPSPRITPETVDAARFHLLPVGGAVLGAVYDAGRIEAEDYLFLDGGVDTVAVQTTLVTYEFDARGNAYHRDSCEMVSTVTHLIATGLDALRAEGHPKWAETDPAAVLEGWSVSDCALRGMTPDFTVQCGAVGP